MGYTIEVSFDMRKHTDTSFKNDIFEYANNQRK